MVHLVQGVGINDRSCPANINGKSTKEYSLWTNMLVRCYSTKYMEKYPTYSNCTVSDTFRYYHTFYVWCQTQIGFNIPDYTLDKDLLIKGNKHYSETNCVFIPKDLNLLLTNRKLDRGLLPIGVTKHSDKFRAICNASKVRKHLGVFDTPEMAFQAYKTFKEAYIKEQAELYKDSIDPRAYLALLNYEVDIDD